MNGLEDWEVTQALANALGLNWRYTHPSEIMDEIARCTPMLAGVSYERLEGYRSLCWPVRKDGIDTPLLYTERFKFPDRKARFHPVQWTPPAVQTDAEYDLYLDNGRVLEHFHEGNLTYRTPGMREKVAGAFVEVSPDLARDRALEEGDWVRLRSRYGELKTRVVVSKVVRDGEMYMPVCSSDERVNLLTSSNKDPAVDTPAYKEVAVTLEKLGERGASPVPRTNPRFGDPTPQKGVEVERKWARSDYREPPRDRPKGGRV
jgi:formate dehydrogenase major subunit